MHFLKLNFLNIPNLMFSESNWTAKIKSEECVDRRALVRGWSLANEMEVEMIYLKPLLNQAHKILDRILHFLLLSTYALCLLNITTKDVTTNHESMLPMFPIILLSQMTDRNRISYERHMVLASSTIKRKLKRSTSKMQHVQFLSYHWGSCMDPIWHLIT